MPVENVQIAHASNRCRGAQSRLAGAEALVERSRRKLARLAKEGAGRLIRAEAQIAIDDAEAAVTTARADLVAAELAEQRIRDLVLADKLERLGGELQVRAEAIDQAMAALVERFEDHRSVMASIAELAPSLTRDLMYRHTHKLPARAAAQHHKLSPRHIPLVRSAFGSTAFATSGVPGELVREVERLRGGSEAEAEAA